jgi:hypothetical protein
MFVSKSTFNVEKYIPPTISKNNTATAFFRLNLVKKFVLPPLPHLFYGQSF